MITGTIIGEISTAMISARPGKLDARQAERRQGSEAGRQNRRGDRDDQRQFQSAGPARLRKKSSPNTISVENPGIG